MIKFGKLLLIVPHFKVFIRDQTDLIRSCFDDVIVVIPKPYFFGLVLKLPYVEKYFRFLRLAEESCKEQTHEYTIINSKFFTLPVDVLRKRNCYLASKSVIRALSRNSIIFDLIHVHFLYSGLIGVKVKKIFNKPLIITAHGSDVYELPFKDEWYRSLTTYILREADHVITVCDFNARKLISLGASPSRLHIIPNGYNEELFKPMSSIEARKKLDLPSNKKILLSVGNLVHAKGHTYLIDAMRIVSRIRKDVLLIIVGSGVLEEELRKKVKRLNLEGKVLLTGSKKHDEIPLWINACDIFVLPSVKEGFPTVIPEALACGKPVIGTKVGGIPEILCDKNVGILISPGDTFVLGDAILNALEMTWQSEMILNYAKQYAWSNLARRIIDLYESLLH